MTDPIAITFQFVNMIANTAPARKVQLARISSRNANSTLYTSDEQQIGKSTNYNRNPQGWCQQLQSKSTNYNRNPLVNISLLAINMLHSRNIFQPFLSCPSFPSLHLGPPQFIPGGGIRIGVAPDVAAGATAAVAVDIGFRHLFIKSILRILRHRALIRFTVENERVRATLTSNTLSIAVFPVPGLYFALLRFVHGPREVGFGLPALRDIQSWGEAHAVERGEVQAECVASEVTASLHPSSNPLPDGHTYFLNSYYPPSTPLPDDHAYFFNSCYPSSTPLSDDHL